MDILRDEHRVVVGTGAIGTGDQDHECSQTLDPPSPDSQCCASSAQKRPLESRTWARLFAILSQETRLDTFRGSRNAQRPKTAPLGNGRRSTPKVGRRGVAPDQRLLARDLMIH